MNLNMHTFKAALFKSAPQRTTDAYQEHCKEIEYFKKQRQLSALTVFVEPLNVGQKTSVSRKHDGGPATWPEDPQTCQHHQIADKTHGGPHHHKTKKCLRCGQVFMLDFKNGMALRPLPETPQTAIQSLYHPAISTEYANYLRQALLEARKPKTKFITPMCWCRMPMKIRYVPVGGFPSSRPVLGCGNTTMVPPVGRVSNYRNDRWSEGCGVVRDLISHPSMVGKMWIEPALAHRPNGDYDACPIVLEVMKQMLPLVSPEEFEQIVNYQHLKQLFKNPVMKVEHEKQMMKSCITIFYPAVCQSKTHGAPYFQPKDAMIVQKITGTGLETWCLKKCARYPGSLPGKWYRIALSDHAGVPPAVGTAEVFRDRNPTTGEDNTFRGYSIGLLDKKFTKEHTVVDKNGLNHWTEDVKKCFNYFLANLATVQRR